MTFGAEESWSLTSYKKDKLVVTQKTLEREMLDVTIKDKMRNGDIKKRTEVRTVEAKGQLAGHLYPK